MKSLGAYVKELREERNLPQRKLAYELDLDVSVLSKIENENKFPQKRITEIINLLSKLFNVPSGRLKQMYLSDRITSLLVDEEGFEDILRVSEEKVNFVRAANRLKN